MNKFRIAFKPKSQGGMSAFGGYCEITPQPIDVDAKCFETFDSFVEFRNEEGDLVAAYSSREIESVIRVDDLGAKPATITVDPSEGTVGGCTFKVTVTQ